jgi:hypothetical protein
MVIVGVAAGAIVVTAVVVKRKVMAPAPVGEPDWAPLRLLEPEPVAVEAPATKWVDPDEHGGCPDSHPVKAKKASRIYHVPGGRFYDGTKANRCFCDGEAAEADGYRASKH